MADRLARALSRPGRRDPRARPRPKRWPRSSPSPASIGVPLVPQGGNTSMVGGATPPEDGSALILSLRRMNRLRSISAEANLAVAEAGMILADLHDEAAEVGRRFPLTLGARGSCTIGGLIATNAGGTQVLRFGTMRALVAGVEAVLARRHDPRRPVGAQEGQSRLQPRPAADRLRRHARRSSPRRR